jgi:hypothetical protein
MKMNSLNYLPLLEKYISQNTYTSKLKVPFLTRKNPYNMEIQNWERYQDLRKILLPFGNLESELKVPTISPV